MSSRAFEVAKPSPELALLLVQSYPGPWREGWYFGWRIAAEVAGLRDPLGQWRAKTKVPARTPEFFRGLRQVEAELDALLRPGQTLLWVRRSPEFLELLPRLGLPRERLQEADFWEPFCTKKRLPHLLTEERNLLSTLADEDWGFDVQEETP